MDIRYYLDPTTGQPHILAQGVDEREVQDVLETVVSQFEIRSKP